MLVTIYCSGSIQKGTPDPNKLCWTDTERKILAEAAQPQQVRFLNPDDPVTDPNNTLGLFGRDMYQVQSADFVVADARQRRGIGIGVEMLAAKLFGTPLVAVAPHNSEYRKDRLTYRGVTVDNYVHFHLASVADIIVDDFAAAGEWIRDYDLSSPATKTKQVVFDAIAEYETNLLPKDGPMLAVLEELRQVSREQL